MGGGFPESLESGGAGEGECIRSVAGGFYPGLQAEATGMGSVRMPRGAQGPRWSEWLS